MKTLLEQLTAEQRAKLDNHFENFPAMGTVIYEDLNFLVLLTIFSKLNLMKVR